MLNFVENNFNVLMVYVSLFNSKPSIFFPDFSKHFCHAIDHSGFVKSTYSLHQAVLCALRGFCWRLESGMPEYVGTWGLVSSYPQFLAGTLTQFQ